MNKCKMCEFESNCKDKSDDKDSCKDYLIKESLISFGSYNLCSEDTVNEMRYLVEKMNIYSDAYYNRNESMVSDYEYDAMFDKLKSLEEKTGIVLSNSPTHRVGYEVKSELQKVKHSHPMLSLDKTKNVNDLIEFADKKDCLLSLKMDGIACLLTYDDGKLIKAETRGNGEIGEDITHNAKVFENIPLTIPNKNHIEIEGEAIITYDDFNLINLELSDENKYKNPRNLVSGSVRQLDSNIASKRHIKFVVWKVPKGFTHYTEGLNFAKKMGFTVVPYIRICEFDDEIDYALYIYDLKNTASCMFYPIDGLVITYDNKEYGDSLGTTSHHPRHSLAYKFDDEEYESTLENIEWQLGKSGIVTPVAVFEPVNINGSVVTKASLSNISVMKSTLGDYPFYEQKVYITKRNEVIPKVERAEWIKPNEFISVFNIPTKCPECGSDLQMCMENKTEFLICTNESCKGKLLAKLKHFVSRDAMNIEGLSEATLQFLIDRNWVNSFEDIYLLDYKRMNWKEYDGFGEKSVDKILDAIETSRTVTLDKFINALSIPNVGKSASKTIAEYFDYDFNEWYGVGISQPFNYTLLNDFGNIMQNKIFSFAKDNKTMILNLAKHMNFVKPERSNNSNNLNGLTFCITGSLNVFKNRNELIKKIEDAGGKVTSSVSKKTSYLINNDTTSTSGKNKKAKELNIPIITENALLDILKC